MSQLYTQIHDPSNFIHPTAILGSDIKLGINNYIGPYCIINQGVEIGDNNRFESHCCVGSAPEHKEFLRDWNYGVRIGNNNIIREFTTINAGTVKDTILTNNIIMLRGSHVGHDCIIEDNVTLSCNSIIGGHSYVMEGANMALGSICHQYSVIGAYSIVGMGGIVTKKSQILCCMKFVGNPVKNIGENTIGIQRNNITKEKEAELIDRYFKLIK